MIKQLMLTISVATCFFLTSQNIAHAYKQVTHAYITTYAVDQSELAQLDLLKDIVSVPILRSQEYLSEYPVDSSILFLTGEGAISEDSGVRAFNHFFNPVTGNGYLGGAASPDWALEDTAKTYVSQEYSYRDAREYFYNGLTEKNPEKRKTELGSMFRSLGQIVHHIEDMSQPQHARVDIHCDIAPCRLAGKYNPSLYEEWSAEQIVIDNLPYSGYESASFPRPRVYWKSENSPDANGAGIAEYTYRGFVSEGTNFDSNKHPVPTPEGVHYVDQIGVSSLFAQALPDALELPPECENELTGKCSMTFITNTVTDSLRPNMTAINERASTLSVFTQDLELYTKTVRYTDPQDGMGWSTQQIMTLNQFNFAAAHQFLIPRAVGYSAGLINYFFRGKFEITPPNNGVYALVDHAKTKAKDSEGFSKVSLKLRNITPDIEWNGATYKQHMENGQLILVAKFKRNVCYRENLAGEFSEKKDATWANNCTVQNYRSLEEYIVKSKPKDNISLSADPDKEADPLDLEYEFEEPIPINATDLVFQMVFKGKLGEENDAVAVTTKDLYEPTYISLYNGSDYYYTWPPKFEEATGYDEKGEYNYLRDSYNLKDNTFKIGDEYEPVFTIDDLEPGSYFRVSLLTDRDVSNYFIESALHTHHRAGRVSDYSFSGTAKSKSNQSSYYEKPGQAVANAYPWQVVSDVEDSHEASAVGRARTNMYYWHMLYFYRNLSEEELTKQELEERIVTLPPGVDANPKPVTLLEQAQ